MPRAVKKDESGLKLMTYKEAVREVERRNPSMGIEWAWLIVMVAFIVLCFMEKA